MAQGNLTVQATVSGGPDGGRTFGPAAVTAASAVASVQTYALVNGANTVTVPSGCTAMVLWPPNATAAGGVTPNPAFGGTLTLKGVAGDTGVAMSNKWMTVLTWDTPPASFVVASTASGSLVAWAM